MESYNQQKWEDLNLSRDEIKNIGQALKKEEFRGLLAEYVKEINDPENRRQYEEEITQLENERGVDITFVHPTSGYVIKTSVDGKSKAFINICSNNNVGVPFSTPEVQGGHKGLHWSIPYCLAPPREDLDKKKELCIVYDVVFHPDTLALSKNNFNLKKLVNETALGALEENFHVSLDKANLKFPKMQFKGFKHATVIRKKTENFQSTGFTEIPNYPYPPLKEDTHSQSDSGPLEQKNRKPSDKIKHSSKGPDFTIPHFSMKHRSTVDMENFTNDPMSKMRATVPNELVIIIDLPLLKSSSNASIDVTEKSLSFISEKPAKYKLDLNLPYSVDSNRGCAKFDLSKKVLIITLPVIKEKLNRLSNIDLSREDSGVESDNGNGRSYSTSSNEEDDSEEVRLITGIEILNNTEFTGDAKANTLDRESFLKHDLHYTMPNYLCKYLEGTLVFTLQVPNVNPEAVEYCFLNEYAGFHMAFVSVGAGYFPVNYAICVLLPQLKKLEHDAFSIEVWDNNVVVLVKLVPTPAVILTEYYIGTDQNNTKKCLLPSTVQHTPEDNTNTTKLKNGSAHCEKQDYDESGSRNDKGGGSEIAKCLGSEGEKVCDISENTRQQLQEDGGNEVPFKVSNEGTISTDELLKEDLYVSESTSSFDESSVSPQRQPAKSRTVSESQQGDVKRSKNRGILKIGRSLSESSVDDYASRSAEKIEKTKKTVRFSEVISQQVFRMNSSILGQRKKNQRKTRNKKRAQERRLSESGNESEGDIEFSELKGKNPENKEDAWLKDPDSTSSCDISEVSDVSDISESDDGQKENGPPLLPCSSRKNHKRRGNKSARKNAATAKFNYMEY